jgi:hypothetical protein
MCIPCLQFIHSKPINSKLNSISHTNHTHLPITALLHLAKLQRAQHLAPERVGRIHKRQLVVVDGRAFPDEIDLCRLEEARALDEFPGEERDWGCADLLVLRVHVLMLPYQGRGVWERGEERD